MNIEQKNRLIALCDNMKSYGYIDGVEELKSIFPQLCESEDDRIRSELIEFIKWSVDRHFMREDFHQAKRPSEWITYLEKQKALSELGKYIVAERTKPGFMFAGNDSVSWEELPLDVRKHDYPYYFIGDLDCYPFDVEKQKEQDKCPEYCVKSHCMDCPIYEKQKEQRLEIELIQRSWYMEGYHDGEFKREPKWILKTGEGCPRHELNPRYGEPLAEQKPIEFKLLSAGSGARGTTPPSFKLDVKPAEWSETDYDMLNNITIAAKFGKKCKPEEIRWLQELPERINFQPKQEWSGEDEYIINTLIHHYELINPTSSYFDKVPKERFLAWLKSLRPQPIQLKEAYKEGFQTARHTIALAFMKYCDKIRPNGKMCLSNGECEEIEKAFLVGDWEKIERYFNKYSWKPSEEQMDALKESISQDCAVCNGDRKWIKPNLESLYEQLKAL